MNRRQLFVNVAKGSLVLLFGGLGMTGCSVFQDLLSWIPVGLTALNSIVTVLGAFMPPGAAAVVTIIKAAFADLSAAITQYDNDTNPADKATLLAKIRTILAAITNNFQSFLDALNLGNNPIINIVVGLVGVILAAIAGFMGQLPATGSTLLTGSYHVDGRQYTIVPKFYKKTSAFKADFNSVCVTYNHPEAKI